jgi:hypothetical protein
MTSHGYSSLWTRLPRQWRAAAKGRGKALVVAGWSDTHDGCILLPPTNDEDAVEALAQRLNNATLNPSTPERGQV